MNININTNGNVTVNVIGRADRELEPVDRSNEVLISNDTSFDELIRILQTNPDAAEAAKSEEEKKARMEKEAGLRREFGEDYDLIFGETGEDGELKKARRRPGAAHLRTYIPRVAKIDLGDDGICEVYSNGYAVYDNGDRKTVLWVPDCGSCTYYFTKLRECEKEYMRERNELGEDILGPLPWYNALMLAGENSIEKNLDHPRSKGTVSDADEMDWLSETPGYYWAGIAHIDTPEEAYFRKVAAEERRNALSDKQKEAYVLHYEEGYTQEETAEILGISQKAVYDRLRYGEKKLKNYFDDTYILASEKSY